MPPVTKEGAMKKFLIVLLVLIILGAAGFFLGWNHLTIPPGSYGVMRSKTHGLESKVIRDGDFGWIWYKLIPTNVKISAYTIGPVKRSFKNSGALGSGQVYAELAGLNADFSWEISGEFSYNLKPDCLPELTERENISDEAGLRKAEDTLSDRIESFVLQRLKAYADEGDDKKMETITVAGSLPELNTEIQNAFTDIENLSCTLRVVRYPDYALYQSLKALYQQYIARQNAALSPDIVKEAQNRIDLRTRLDELTQYGELLTKYPVLLQYLALEKGLTPAAPVTSQSGN